MRTRVAVFSAALFFVTFGESANAEMRARPATDWPQECGVLSAVDRAAHIAKLDIQYPKGESDELGEGWVQVIYRVRPDGSLASSEIIDAMGTPAYGGAVQEALRKATFTPAVAAGKPADGNSDYDVLFAIEGNNRALVHYFGFSETYDAARRQRMQKQYEASIATTQKSFADPLNMYEIATLSHGQMLSYIGLKDYRHALIHARHAALERGRFLANDARPQAQAWLTWLEAANNNQRNALCAFAWLKRDFTSYEADADTIARVEQARAELNGTGIVRTPIELIGRGRTDVPAGWEHELIRRTFRFEHAVPGQAKVKLACQGATEEHEVADNKSWVIEPKAGACTLYFYGPIDTKFDLIEGEQVRGVGL